MGRLERILGAILGLPGPYLEVAAANVAICLAASLNWSFAATP